MDTAEEAGLPGGANQRGASGVTRLAWGQWNLPAVGGAGQRGAALPPVPKQPARLCRHPHPGKAGFAPAGSVLPPSPLRTQAKDFFPWDAVTGSKPPHPGALPLFVRGIKPQKSFRKEDFPAQVRKPCT